MAKPNFSLPKVKVIILAEGEEEKDYIDKLISLDGVWNKDKYKIMTQDSPRGYDNLFEAFSNEYKNMDGQTVLTIFCDTEMPNNKEYKNINDILKQMNNVFGIDEQKAINNIVFYVNPNSMKVILSHFGAVTIKKTDLSYIRDMVKSNAKVDLYDKGYDKRHELINKISASNYKKLKKNITGASNSRDYHIKNSTNILILFNNLESDDTSWIKKTRNVLKIKDS